MWQGTQSPARPSLESTTSSSLEKLQGSKNTTLLGRPHPSPQRLSGRQAPMATPILWNPTPTSTTYCAQHHGSQSGQAQAHAGKKTGFLEHKRHQRNEGTPFLQEEEAFVALVVATEDTINLSVEYKPPIQKQQTLARPAYPQPSLNSPRRWPT
jgi:hypothetical protein